MSCSARSMKVGTASKSGTGERKFTRCSQANML
jgi:hypothetical protein